MENNHVTPAVIMALESEEAYCKTKWALTTPNGRAHDDRSVDEWILYMEDYIQEARHQAARGNERAALGTIRKVTNLGVKCMKQHGSLMRSGAANLDPDEAEPTGGA